MEGDMPTLHCTKHKHEELQLFCTVCKLAVCRECIVDSHQKHEFSKLENEVEEAKENLCQLIKRVEEEVLPILLENLQSARSQKTLYAEAIERLVTELHEKAEELKSVIDDITSSIEEWVRKTHNEDEREWTSVIGKLDESVKRANAIIESSKPLLSCPSIDVITKKEEIADFLKEDEIRIPEISLPVRSPGILNKDVLCKMIGKFSKRRTSNEENVHSGSLLKNPPVRVGLYSVTGLRCISEFHDNTAWITKPNTGNILDKIRVRENSVYLSESIELDRHLTITDISFSNQGNVYFTAFKSTIIKTLKKGNRKPNIFVNMSDLQPYGLCVTQQNEIVVSVVESNSNGSYFNRKGKLIKFSESGERIGEIEYCDRKRLFVLPRFIAENRNEDLCISDMTNKIEGRVVVVDVTGKLKFIYTGPDSMPCLKPRAITCDHESRIIITDKRNDAVHIIDKDGNFLKFLVTKEEGLSEPCSVTISSRGALWFGCSNSKLYMLKYST